MNLNLEDDDRSSSADSFSLVEDQNKADDADGGHNPHGNQLVNHHENKEESAKSPFKSTSIVEVAQVSYNRFVIRVFTDVHSPAQNGRCFYFEPVVLLSPKSIVSESNELLKQDLVRFKIKMWNPSIRSKVIDRLRSLPSLKDVDIQEEDVRVMPYEEVQLVVRSDSIPKSIRLADEATSYRRLNETLDFDFECDLPSVADSLAENLKKNPELIIKKWKLALECRGLALDSGAGSIEMTSSKEVDKRRPTWIYNVSALSSIRIDNIAQESPLDGLLPRLEGYDNEIQGLREMIESAKSISMETSTKYQVYEEEIQGLKEMITSERSISNEATTKNQKVLDEAMAVINKKSATCVPVFSAEGCTNPEAVSGQSFAFSNFAMDAKSEHGDFDLSTGIFTVKTAGNYLLNFSGHVHLVTTRKRQQAELRINGVRLAFSINQSESTSYQPVVISALVPLKVGDRVGIFAHAGKLYDDGPYKTLFYGVLFLE